MLLILQLPCTFSSDIKLQNKYTPSSGALPSKKIFLHHKYFNNVHRINVVLFTVLSTVKRTK